MYKWHVQTAIGHHRPLASDFSRAAEGIAASLRQFHISASQSEEKGKQQLPGFRISRTSRSAAAAAEISSLNASPPRPIDARALAAKPPAGFTIRRYEVGDDLGGQDSGSFRGGFRGGFRERGARGGGVMTSVGGGFRGGLDRGRGRVLGLGRGRGRGRGMRGRGRGGRARGKKRQAKEFSEHFGKKSGLTEEEQKYMDGVSMGIRRPYQPGGTPLENLELEMPPVATTSAPLGLVSTIKDRMKALSGRTSISLETSRMHSEDYVKRNGTLFVDDQDKAGVEADRAIGGVEKYDTLTEAQREVILKSLVAGHYQKIEPPRKEELMSVLQSYGQRNETYLPSDTKALRDKAQTLLPIKKAATSRKEAARR